MIFLSFGHNVSVTQADFLSAYVLYSQGTLSYGQIFSGKMFARVTRTCRGRCSVLRAKYVSDTEADCLSVHVLYSQGGTFVRADIFQENGCPYTYIYMQMFCLSGKICV